MHTLLRIICCAAAGVACGISAEAWCRLLFRRRGLDYPLSRRNGQLLAAAMVLPGGAVGAFTAGLLLPVYGLLLLTVCAAVALADGAHRIIPNPTVLALFALKLLFGVPALLGLAAFPAFNIVRSLIGLAACFAVFSLPALFGRKVGAGDVKLAAATGFFLEITPALLAVAVMGVLVIGYGAVRRNAPLLTFLKTNIPMGPFIAAGMFAAFLFSEYIL